MTPPKRPSGRGLRKTLTCALVVIALQLSLLAVPELPAPVSELGTPAAAAQPSRDIEIVNGTAGACPTDPVPWSPVAGDADYDTATECRLELPACPVNPVRDPASDSDRLTFMLLSSPPTGLAGLIADDIENTFFPAYGLEYPNIGLARYTDFCELRVLDNDPDYSNGAVAYSTCMAATGYFFEAYTDSGVNGCRLVRQIKCPDGLQFVTSKTCRGVQRRTWMCTTNETHHNVFNRCIRETTPGAGTHPACNPRRHQ